MTKSFEKSSASLQDLKDKDSIIHMADFIYAEQKFLSGMSSFSAFLVQQVKI